VLHVVRAADPGYGGQAQVRSDAVLQRVGEGQRRLAVLLTLRKQPCAAIHG
jgi:hypothetical protein